MVAGYTMGTEPSARESLVIVIKGTFSILNEPGAMLRLHAEQVPLVMSDVFFGEPGLSAPKYEIDFPPLKPSCEVVLNCSAYAPGGRPAERVTVSAQIGNWSKSFDVVGDRTWYMAAGMHATEPNPFISMPISYDRAFGGVDLRHEDSAQHAAYMSNPTGRGFHKHLRAEWIQSSPIANTEESGDPVTRPDGTYRPMSFGVIGRHWEPRAKFAGTYDQNWIDNVFPFLPEDFDPRYYQSAPPDQQLGRLSSEQRVTLANLTPAGHTEFVLPHFEAPIHIFPVKGDREDYLAPLDTIVIEPDLERVTMTWRLLRPLRKSMFEIARVLVGRKGREWWQRQEEIAFSIPAFRERPVGATHELRE
jgi:hypothetical protein